MNVFRQQFKRTYEKDNASDFDPTQSACVLGKEKKCLDYFQAMVFTTIIEDVILNVNILSQMNNRLNIEKTLADAGFLKSLKYSVVNSREEYEGDTVIDAKKLDCAEYKLYKLFEDRKYLLQVLEDTYNDLVRRLIFRAMSEHNSDKVAMEEYRAQLVEDERANKQTRRELHKQLRALKNNHKAALMDTNQLIDDLRTQVEDEYQKTAIRLRYIEKWQNSRVEQNKHRIVTTEAGPGASGDYYKMRLEFETRAHGDVEILTTVRINEILEQISESMVTYDTDIENIDLKIQLKRIAYSDQMERRRELEETIKAHAAEMERWNEFKAEREAARAYREKMTNAAVAVQAWWRGMLVRCQLGPFRTFKDRRGRRQSKAKAKKKK